MKTMEDKMWDCLRDLYLNSDPPLDIGKDASELLEKVPDAKDLNVTPAWYLRYKIDKPKYDEIVQSHIKNCRFRGSNREMFERNLAMFLLSFSPAFKEVSNGC
jgi:hypothetical protein